MAQSTILAPGDTQQDERGRHERRDSAIWKLDARQHNRILAL